MDPATLFRTFFGFGIAVDIGGTLIPSFRENVMSYGLRQLKTPESPAQVPGTLIRLLKYIASFQVPHTWFTHYYIVSVASSIFWAFQLYTCGTAYQLLVTYSKERSTSMTGNQIILAWFMMAFQGARRLYESATLSKPSQSKMWVGLWAIGIVYYVFMGMSVWIEGISILEQKRLVDLLEISLPSAKTSVAIPVFLIASVVQHSCHKHLASLRKYTLPHSRPFLSVICPHYTSECMIYIALALLSAPQGRLVNRTVLAGLGFVATNLAVTADSTRTWYAEKFGAEKLEGRWRMVPYLY